MKKVLIIGAGFLQSYVIRCAKSLGYYTLAVDGNKDAVGFAFADESRAVNIVDKDACLAYAKEKQVDGVLTAATDYGVLTASYIADQMGLPGLKPEVAKVIKNKYLVRKCLAEAHADDTPFAYEVNADTNLSELADKVVYPVMVKPCDGSGSRGAGRVNERSEFAAACKFAMDSSITHRAVVEPFIFGQEYGAESFVENGKVHVLAVMHKWMTEPPYYAELGHAIPSLLPPKTEAHVKECVTKALRALGVNFGSVNMDLLITEQGDVHIVDVGARMGGNLIGSHIIPLGTGIEYMANMIRGAVGDPMDFEPKAHGPVATKLLALTPGKVKALPDFNAIAKKYNVKIEHHLHVGDEITPYRTNLDGCGYTVASGDDVTDNVARAEEARKEIDRLIVRE